MREGYLAFVRSRISTAKNSNRLDPRHHVILQVRADKHLAADASKLGISSHCQDIHPSSAKGPYL